MYLLKVRNQKRLRRIQMNLNNYFKINKKGLAEEKQLLLLFEVLIIIVVIIGLVFVVTNREETTSYKDIDKELTENVIGSISDNIVVAIVEEKDDTKESTV